MEVKYMEIFEDELNKLTYCTEVTTSRSLNKFTDKIKVYYHKYITGESYFDFYFGRTYKGKLMWIRCRTFRYCRCKDNRKRIKKRNLYFRRNCTRSILQQRKICTYNK